MIAQRDLTLQQGVASVVSRVGVTAIDKELAEYAPSGALTRLAALGIRGERVFPVPVVIGARPSLIGYYRMLLGASKKDFQQKFGYGRFVTAEEKGTLSNALVVQLPDLCRAFADALADLVEGLYAFTERDLSDLSLLTLGPTLQGRRNNTIGSSAGRAVMDAVRVVVGPSIEFESETHFRLRNAAGRIVEIDFGSDPDVRVSELSGAERMARLAMEIKGGADVSNAHNRAGEAEKSHLKAAQSGYNERWTLIALRGMSFERIKGESPSTTRFIDVVDVMKQSGPGWDEFRTNLAMLSGYLSYNRIANVRSPPHG